MKRSQNLAGEEFRGRIGKTVYEWVDGQTVADGKIPRVLGMLSSTGMDIGRAIAPVNRDYNPPFAYGGHIQRVVFELPARRSERDRTEYAKREARAAMTRQ